MTDVNLRDLEAFAAVARARHFRKAAQELRVSVSTLSQRIKDLEDRLGLRLLNRTTRSVAPTEAGERLLERVGPALADIGDAIGDIRSLGDRPSGRLRINAPAPAVQHVLAPMVGAFLRQHPAVELSVLVEPDLVDIVEGGFDAGVRYEEHLDQDMIAVPLGPPQRYAVTAAPSLIERYGRPREPKDLLGLPAVSTVFPGGRELVWEFEKDGRVVKIAPTGPLKTQHMGLQLRAAIDGVGFYATFHTDVAEAIASGLLVEVLADWCPPFAGPFLYYPSRRQPPPALAAFIAFAAVWRRQWQTGT